MFDDKSRYQQAETYECTDRRERTVKVTTVPVLKSETFRGYHQRIQGQRIDHMAYKYLGDNAGFWRICELNDVMLAEALTEASDIAIPKK